jgi:hypothetical protein
MVPVTRHWLGALLLVLAAAPASAQSINTLLPGLAASGARLDPDAAHFLSPPGGGASMADVSNAIGTRLSTFPLFPTWGVPVPGTAGEGDNLVLSSGSFGQGVATGGRGHFRMGLVHQGIEYGRIDGFDLRDSDLKVALVHTGSHFSSADADAIEQVVSMDLDRKATGLFAAVGVTDRLDVGVIVPMVHVNVNARITSYLRRAPGSSSGTHGFDALQLANRTMYGDWTRNGLGDVEVRAKLRAASQFALTGGVRLPTGDENDWLGSGALQVSGGAIWSGRFGRVAPRVNAGYTYSREDEDAFEMPHEINYGGGVDIALSRFVSVSGDAVGRTLRDVARLRSGTIVLPGTTGAPGTAATAGLTSDGVLLATAETSNVQTMFGAAGIRVLVARHLLLSGDYMFPILDRGLAPKMGVMLGANLLF